MLADKATATYIHTLTVAGRLRGQYRCNVSNNKPSEASASLTVRGKRECKERAKEGECTHHPLVHMEYS